MNFIVGDIHGEETKLKSLIKNIFSIDRNASFVFIGDYLDKGENPYATLLYLNDFSKKTDCIFLRGNHEFSWEQLSSNTDSYAKYLEKYGGRNTILSIRSELSFLEAKQLLLDKFESFFSSLKYYHQLDKYIITHSGIPSDYYSIPIENIPFQKFLFNRYDFIKQQKKYFDRIVVFGHTGFYTPYFDGFKIGIDTAACYIKSQPLTAFCTDEKFFINSNKEIQELSSININICPTIPRVKAWQQL